MGDVCGNTFHPGAGELFCLCLCADGSKVEQPRDGGEDSPSSTHSVPTS